MFAGTGIIEEESTYFCSTEESSESSPTTNSPEVHLPEIRHLASLSSVNEEWTTLNTGFKESDAYWLLFFALSSHYKSYSEPSSDPSSIGVKR